MQYGLRKHAGSVWKSRWLHGMHCDFPCWPVLAPHLKGLLQPGRKALGPFLLVLHYHSFVQIADSLKYPTGLCRCMLPAYGAGPYIPALVLERPVTVRERSDGLYNAFTYLCYKVTLTFNELPGASSPPHLFDARHAQSFWTQTSAYSPQLRVVGSAAIVCGGNKCAVLQHGFQWAWTVCELQDA